MKYFITLFCIACTTLFGSIETSRNVLSSYSNNHPSVLHAYDTFVTSLQNEDYDLLLQAIEYAAEKHEGQVRKDHERTPYIIHPIGVAYLLYTVGKVTDEEVLVSALLHDTLEDTDATEEEIAKRFGEHVAQIVKELTNDPHLTTAENKQRQVDHAPFMSPEAKLVKLADRIYNVTDLMKTPPPSFSQEKIHEYFGWAKKLHKAISGINQDLEDHLEQLIADHYAHR